MELRTSTRETLSRPKDRSLEAFKLWMTEIAERLTTQKEMIKLTDEEWKKNWKEFWQQKSNF
jgi:sulfur relay (sulfurtransferase) DsrC/TusE family protein